MNSSSGCGEFGSIGVPGHSWPLLHDLAFACSSSASSKLKMQPRRHFVTPREALATHHATLACVPRTNYSVAQHILSAIAAHTDQSQYSALSHSSTTRASAYHTSTATTANPIHQPTIQSTTRATSPLPIAAAITLRASDGLRRQRFQRDPSSNCLASALGSRSPNIAQQENLDMYG